MKIRQRIGPLFNLSLKWWKQLAIHFLLLNHKMITTTDTCHSSRLSNYVGRYCFWNDTFIFICHFNGRLFHHRHHHGDNTLEMLLKPHIYFVQCIFEPSNFVTKDIVSLCMCDDIKKNTFIVHKYVLDTWWSILLTKM